MFFSHFPHLFTSLYTKKLKFTPACGKSRFKIHDRNFYRKKKILPKKKLWMRSPNGLVFTTKRILDESTSFLFIIDDCQLSKKLLTTKHDKSVEGVFRTKSGMISWQSVFPKNCWSNNAPKHYVNIYILTKFPFWKLPF